MKFREIVRFELVYQARRVRTWLYFAVLLVVAYLLTKNGIEGARDSRILANSPFGIAVTTVLCNLVWTLIATAIAGSAASRDVQTRMHPLVYTTPISKADYLGGRFLAALVLNASILLMVPAGIGLALLVPGAEPEILGPFRSAAYLNAYVVLALPTAFAVTATQFALAARRGRTAASYVGSVLLLLTAFPASGAMINLLRMPTLGKLLDPMGLHILSSVWTPLEKNTLLVGMQGSMLANRILWIGIGIGALAFTYRRFQVAQRRAAPSLAAPGVLEPRHRESERGSPPRSRSQRAAQEGVAFNGTRTFGFATHARQTWAIATTSFGAIAKGATGFALWVTVATLVILSMPLLVQVGGVPFVARTAQIVPLLTAPVAAVPRGVWVLVPLLIVFYAGELVGRERDAGLSEIVDATPVPEWVFFLGKFLGLSLLLAVWMALLTTGGVLGQMRMGYFGFEIGLYLKILFGIQLLDYLLFALLVFVLHAVVNQRQIGYLVALLAYEFIAFASRLGIEQKLLVYAAGPGWTYSDMRGFGASVGPWFWFKAYWTAWALLLAVAARLLWVRGKDLGPRSRLPLARHRWTGRTIGVAAAAGAMLLSVGGFVVYNTNVLNASTADRMERSAEYERRYARYNGIPQPRPAAMALRAEIYPERREAEIHGIVHLVNDSGVAIESIHLTTAAQVGTRALSFDRRIARTLDDEELGYRIYTLEEPLRPGDTLQMSFEVRFAPHGFTDNGAEAAVVANGTSFATSDWLPAIGYQSNRELKAPGARRRYGLVPRPALPSLDDAAARRIRVGGDPLAFEAIVGTSGDQVALAPGALRRTWTEGGRRYFHYVADAPIDSPYTVFSARYALHEEEWRPSTGRGPAVAIQVFYDPRHVGNLTRMVRAARASLTYHTERFGPYPRSYLRLIEDPARGMGVESEAATVDYGERFSLLNPGDGPRDPVFAVVAHAVAHEWWGMQVAPAEVEGAGLLDRTLETYSAMQIVEEALGPEPLRLYMGFLREATTIARSRESRPLLRATDPFAFSRRGPLALYALRESIGKERVDGALKRLFERYRSGAPPLPTSRDLYRELQSVTPEPFQTLLYDLFEKNTFWELETERAAARQTDAGAWQVTLEARARKVVVDEAGVETEVPMDDWIEIGVFGEGETYVQKHRIRSGSQTITVSVPRKPTHAGIDPNQLLIDSNIDDNDKVVRIEN